MLKGVDKKRIVYFFLAKNLLISSDFFDFFTVDQDLNAFYENQIKALERLHLIVVNKDLLKISGCRTDADISEFNRLKVAQEKDNCSVQLGQFIASQNTIEAQPPKTKDCAPVKISFSYVEKSKKRTYDDFVSYFRSRYNKLRSILINRQELANVLSINKILDKKDKDVVSFIAMVTEKQVTKNQNIVLTVEDLTGSVKVLVSKSKAELYAEAKDISLDEVLAFQGTNGNKIIFANMVLWPDIPLNKELKKSPDDAHVVFLSDTEFGSKYFLAESFNKFIRWINGEMGTDEQKAVASKVKYIFICGDLVIGVGVYPRQEPELAIPDIYLQYEELAKNLEKIPKHIKIIVCPGNHDAMRLAEPQPPLYEDFAKPLFLLKNVIFVSNPAYVNIHSSETFSGFDVLLYHGASLIYYSENVESIRNLGGQERVDLIMKFLLRTRHLAPTHQSSQTLPTAEDHLVIEKIPDFFITGHIHRTSVSNYRNITLINASAWTGLMPNQEKLGIKPQPARAIIVNLQTRQTKIMSFDLPENLSISATIRAGADKA